MKAITFIVAPHLGKTSGSTSQTLRIIAFLTDFSVVDKIINHLKLGFVASKPPPPQVAYQEVLMAATTAEKYSLIFLPDSLGECLAVRLVPLLRPSKFVYFPLILF